MTTRRRHMRASGIAVIVFFAACPTQPADSDAGAHDASVIGLDASPDADASRSDAGSRDATKPDAALPDAAVPDAATTPDASAPDAAQPDAATAPDAGNADSGPSDAGVREGIDVIGFGASARGGWQEGRDETVVTSLLDDGEGTLRFALQSGGTPRVITFALDGTIDLVRPLIVPSNVSIDGRGRNITLRGKGLVLPGSDDVILTNLAIADVGPSSEDGVQIGSGLPDPSERIVLDHLRFSQSGNGGDSSNVDEAISAVFGSRDITVQWCRFERWEKVMLFGNGDAAPELDAQQRITVHHNYALETGRRHPQARHGLFHFFNNFWDDWHMYGPFFLEPYYESFGAQAQDGARILVEGTIVRRHPHNYENVSQANDVTRCESGGDIVERGTWVEPTSTAPLEFGVGCAGTASITLPYSATVEPAGEALRDTLLQQTGNTL